MKALKQLTALVLILALLCSFCACGGEKEPEGPKENQFYDAAGRIVTMPENPSEATAASVYAVASPFFVALGISDRVKAINVKRQFLKKNDPGLSKAGTVGNGVVDLEKLAQFNPTVLVHRSNDPETVKAVTNIGVDVICITVENMEDVENTLKMLGRYFGADAQAEKACSWLSDKFALIDSITKDIPQDQKKTALVMGGELGRVAGSDMLQTWMIEKAGGIPVVDTGKDHNWVTVGVEKVFEYDPEFIFCTGSTARDYTVTEMVTDQAWSAVKAVKSMQHALLSSDSRTKCDYISVIPCTQDPWDMPGPVAVIGTFYMLRTMYPERFSEEQLQEQVDDYYEFMFGKSFTRDELGWDQP